METVNSVLGNPYVAAVLFLMGVALVGHVVKPLPKVLEKLYDSMVVKALVLLVFMMVVLGPMSSNNRLTEEKMVAAVVATVVLLLVMEGLRSMN